MNRFFKNVVLFCNCEEALLTFTTRSFEPKPWRVAISPLNFELASSLRCASFLAMTEWKYHCKGVLLTFTTRSREPKAWRVAISPFSLSCHCERSEAISIQPTQSLRGGMTFADEATSPLWFFHPLMGGSIEGVISPLRKPRLLRHSATLRSSQ